MYKHNELNNEQIKQKLNPKDPHILDKVAQCYSPVLVGEENNIKFLFLCCISKDLPQKYRMHTVISSQSSAGKTSLIRKVSEAFARHVIDYTNFSGAFLKRQQESMDGKILLIEQMEKTNDKNQVSLFELKFLLSEGKLKVGIAEKDEKGKHKPKTLEVTGIPVVITTSTKMSIDQETLNRMFLTQADESQQQTEKIVDFTLKSFSTLKLNDSWKVELEYLTEFAEKYRQLSHQVTDIIIPFGDKIKNIVPYENLTIRRDLRKILSLTCIIAFIHAANRYRIQDNNGANFFTGNFVDTEKRYLYSIIAQPEDFKEAVEIAGSTIKQTLNKVNEASMNLYGRIIELYDSKTYECATLDGNEKVYGLTIKEIAENIGKSTNRTRELMTQLETGGYINRDRSNKEHTFMPTGKKFDEIKLEEISFSEEEFDSWVVEQTAKHGERLSVITPSCNTKKDKDDTK